MRWSQRGVFLFFILSCVFGKVVSTEKVWAELAWEELPRLRERQELENLYASAGNPCVVAIEEKLPAGTAFEVRVSYLATTPAEFNFEVVDFTALSDAVAEKKDELRRRRLNTERFRIETDSERRVVGVDGDHPVLVIYARRVGVRPSMHEVEQVDNPEVRFNVVLDPLVLMKSVPQSALPMVGWGVVSVAFALLCLAPSLQSRFFLPQRVD